MRLEATTDNTSIIVSWEWSRQGLPLCIDLARVNYQPEGGSLMMYTVSKQQQPVLPCPTSSATQIIPAGFMFRVAKLENQVSTEWFLYQQEVCRYSSHTVQQLLL